MQEVFGYQQVISRPSVPEREDRRVFQEKDKIRQTTPAALGLHQGDLEFPGFPIVHEVGIHTDPLRRGLSLPVHVPTFYLLTDHHGPQGLVWPFLPRAYPSLGAVKSNGNPSPAMTNGRTGGTVERGS